MLGQRNNLEGKSIYNHGNSLFLALNSKEMVFEGKLFV